jgi:Spy/CpxP family protein refolding chaperone
MNSTRVGVSVMGLVLAAGMAWAEPPAAAAPKSDDDAMRGPSVKETAKAVTLVKRDMSGTLERLDTRPEQAAVGLLGLSAEEKAAPEKVLTDRFTAVMKLLQEKYELFLKLQGARQSGAKPPEIRPLMREMHEAAQPLLDTPLEDQVEKTLPDGKRAEFRRLVDEYKQVMAAEEPGGMGAGNGAGGGKGRGKGEGGGKAEPKPDAAPASSAPATQAGKASAEGPIPPRVEMNLLLREMGRALNAMVTERKERLQSLLKAVDATPEQEGKIQAIVRAQADENKKAGAGIKERTAEERLAVWEQIMAVLTPEQRVKAREIRRGG